ncbi:MAG: alpha/beta hydrolase [Comamonadaceae bacterium]|nr:MAG: alpha/beta hydrolase [Comamonadaceae bacterium]
MAAPATIPFDGGDLPGLADEPGDPVAALVLGHGAGAGMAHPFLETLAGGLAGQGIAVLRYQFPFMARGSRRVDAPAVAQAAVRAACAAAACRWPSLPLFAGGKSFGARMASQAQGAEPLPGVRGLVFVGFPLHPAGKPAVARADHLAQVRVPMLFLQGTRDALADLSLVTQVAQALGGWASLHVVDGADHGFDVLVRSGRTAVQVQAELVDAVLQWVQGQSG